MAVEAQQQFLQSAPLLYNNSNGDSRGELPLDVCCGRLQQQQQHQHHQVRTTAACSAFPNQQLSPTASSRRPQPSTVFTAESSCSVASEIDAQTREIDQFLRLQSLRLRGALQQQMKHHLVSFMRTLEAKASALLRHKEEQLARASKTTAELEERLRRSEAESQAWQRMAQESEAMALALSNTLEQVSGNAGLSSSASAAAPAGSCCNSSSDPSPGGGGEAAARGWCRGCGLRESRVLFLPCMHLCACEPCGALLASCPVCGSVKQGSIEVFFA